MEKTQSSKLLNNMNTPEAAKTQENAATPPETKAVTGASILSGTTAGKLVKNEYFLLAMFLAFAVLVATIYNQLSIWTALRFLAYQLFCMLLPGVALLRLIRFPSKNRIEEMGMAYIVGYCISILTYIAAIPFKFLTDQWMMAIPIISLLLTLLSGGYLLIRFRPKITAGISVSYKNDLKFIEIALPLVFVIYLIGYGIPNRMPGLGHDQAYYCDTLYWAGNALSLSRGFPPESMRGAGQIINYHYFSSIQLVTIEKTVGISIEELALAYSYIQSVLVVTFGLYIWFDSLFDKKWKTALGMLLVILSSGYQEMTGSYITSHMIVGPFGFEFGIGISAAALSILYKIYKDGYTSWRSLGGIFLLLLSCCVGIKSPVGVLLLGMEGLFCIYLLLQREKKYVPLILGAVSLILFFAIYILFIGESASSWNATASTESSSSNTSATASMLQSILSLDWYGTSRFAKVLIPWYRGYNWNNIRHIFPFNVLLFLELMLKYVFFSNMAIIFLAICALIRKCTQRGKGDILQWFFIIVGAVSIYATLFISLVGNSQVYFIEAGMIYIVSFALYKPNAYPPLPPKIKRLKWAVALPLVTLCVFNAVSFIYPIVADEITTILTERITLTSRFAYNYESNTITTKEIEGYNWLKENADFDAILINNASLYERGPFKTSVFSERRMYVESNNAPSVSREEADKRFAQITQFMNGEEEGYLALKENDVDYAIILTRYETGKEYTTHLNCVFANSDIRIYDLSAEINE